MGAKDFETGSSIGSSRDDASHVDMARHATHQPLSPELFERLYLQPRTEVKGGLRQTFANPTPVGLMGLAVALTPLAAELMGWRGSGGDGAATICASIWFGGMLLLFAGIGEFLLGNTFSCVVFMGYAGHFLTFATTFMPFFNAISFYTGGVPNSLGSQKQAAEFSAGFAFYPLAMTVLNIIFLICSLRTNLVFVLIFLSAAIGFGCGAGAFWQAANNNLFVSANLTVGCGACFFAAAVLNFYMLLAVMLPTMDLPVPNLPIFDLSTRIRAKHDESSG